MKYRKARLLIVDGDVRLLTLLATLCSELAFNVSTASRGRSALLQMRRTIPDVLLSDLRVSDMSGYELIAAVRQIGPAVRIIAMGDASITKIGLAERVSVRAVDPQRAILGLLRRYLDDSEHQSLFHTAGRRKVSSVAVHS